MVRSAALSVDPVTPEIVLMRSNTDRLKEKLESNFHASTILLAELSLMMKKIKTTGKVLLVGHVLIAKNWSSLPTVIIITRTVTLDVRRLGRLSMLQRRADLASKESCTKCAIDWYVEGRRAFWHESSHFCQVSR